MNFNQLTTDISNRPTWKKLSELINALRVVQISGPVDVGVQRITSDSRCVEDRTLFVALVGEHEDGHRFVQRAIEQGASAVVIQREQYETSLTHLLSAAYSQHNQTAVVIVENTRIAFAHIASEYYGAPAKKLRLIGITGTNGKTTTAYLIKSILEQAGEKVGVIGTIGYQFAGVAEAAAFTTPLPDALHELFSRMLLEGCTTVVMEVSSHALALERVHGISFDVSLFTNLTQDHLDFHGSMENYLDAKKTLFDQHTKTYSLFNADDPAAKTLACDTTAEKIFYGENATSDYRMVDLQLSPDATSFTLMLDDGSMKIHSPLIGKFNAYNVLAAVSVGIILGIEWETIARGISNVRSVRGRFERFVSKKHVTAIVDYSHTPDSLRKCLETIREIRAQQTPRGKIITVFGCGGDRDKGKRPIMGAIAQELSDNVIVTSDNPRTEDPARIIREIMEGIQPSSMIHTMEDRRQAIDAALAMAEEHDVVLVAGKGHEDYQIIGENKQHFDDREIIEEYFHARHGGLIE